MRCAHRLWLPFSRFPPLLGAILHGLVMAVLGSFMLLWGPPARQVPLFIIMIALFTLVSYGERVVRQRTAGHSDHNNDAGDQSGPPPDSPE